MITEEEEIDETEDLNDETEKIISHAEDTAALDVTLRYIEQQPNSLPNNVFFFEKLARQRSKKETFCSETNNFRFNFLNIESNICKKVKDSPDFEEEFVRGCLEEIVKQREELKAQAEAAELKRTEALRQEREFELEKMRISNAAEVSSVASTEVKIAKIGSV
ncbi:hypothetical protein AVEN_158851-1 [Araneus ventricosus]|uniref:Uncharacterized protein n=1 Tax=Araneus ventricosus TaxID=182803 RepID=A0A4Y2E922_ARAVE|nr:hypothetical protein AVEN_158851-1 [Araneus ventricosus]